MVGSVQAFLAPLLDASASPFALHSCRDDSSQMLLHLCLLLVVTSLLSVDGFKIPIFLKNLAVAGLSCSMWAGSGCGMQVLVP